MTSKRIQCDTCPFCLRKHTSGFDKTGRAIPPRFEQYQCLKTMFIIGNRSMLYQAPDWCPKVVKMKKEKKNARC